MRVVSGIAGGIPLIAPKTDLRPTMDRVKGAIFDSLGEAILGARVLDLFAGSGSLGIGGKRLAFVGAHVILSPEEGRIRGNVGGGKRKKNAPPRSRHF